MSQQELLIYIVKKLDLIGIEYMLTGSTVSSIQGEPRSTHDIDIIISIKEVEIEKFFSQINNKDFYLEKEAIQDAVRNQTMFNLIEINSGDKIDFWILTDDPFDKSRFSRKQKINIFNYDVNITSCEDTMLMKLKWAHESGGSEKQLYDVLRLYELNFNQVDINYINFWIEKLNVKELWNEITIKADLS